MQNVLFAVLRQEEEPEAQTQNDEEQGIDDALPSPDLFIDTSDATREQIPTPMVDTGSANTTSNITARDFVDYRQQKRIIRRLSIIYGIIAAIFAAKPLYEWTVWKAIYSPVEGTVVQRTPCLTDIYEFGTEVIVEYEIADKKYFYETECFMNDGEDHSSVLPPEGATMNIYYVRSDPDFDATEKTWRGSSKGGSLFLGIAIISCIFSLMLWLYYTKEIWSFSSDGYLIPANIAIIVWLWCSICLFGHILLEA